MLYVPCTVFIITCLHPASVYCTTSHTPIAWYMVDGVLNVGMMKTGNYNTFTFRE